MAARLRAHNLSDYHAAHPTQGLLIVEVAKSSLAKDLGPKARLYAESGVSEYWVVNLVDGVVEAFTEPRGGLYRQTSRYLRGDTIAMKELDGVEIAVADIILER